MHGGLLSLCNTDHDGLDARPIEDPLTVSMSVGLCAPCCAFMCCQPDKSQNLYHLKIKSTHTTTVLSGESTFTYPTSSINLIALAPSAEACLQELRSQAEKAKVAPDTLSMVRGAEGPRGPATALYNPLVSVFY